MTIHAYCRVSTLEQTTDNQRKAILDAGFRVDEWHTEDGVSGTIPATKRPAFSQLMSIVTEGDIVLVTLLDRLGRDAEDILHTINVFKRMGVRLKIIQLDSVDVTSTVGKLLVTMLSAVAEMERNMIAERTKAGMARTKESGTKLGRPLVIAPAMLTNIVADANEGVSLDKLAAKYGFPRNTIHTNVKRWADNLEGYAEEFAARALQYASKAV